MGCADSAIDETEPESVTPDTDAALPFGTGADVDEGFTETEAPDRQKSIPPTTAHTPAPSAAKIVRRWDEVTLESGSGSGMVATVASSRAMFQIEMKSFALNFARQPVQNAKHTCRTQIRLSGPCCCVTSSSIHSLPGTSSIRPLSTSSFCPMSMESGTAFLSEIGIASFGFAPKGWTMCNGQLLPINQNQGLFSLLGTTFGGDGRVNFGLPDLRGRVPMHMGSSGTGSYHNLGEVGGQESHVLTQSEMPQHIHVANAMSTAGDTNLPAGNMLANSAPNDLYGPAQDLSAFNAATVSSVGGSQAHTNMQPFLVLNFCIALQGVFPSQT
jgi:microcystin-dependent protein